jgi:hypothetical protein
LRRTTPNRSNSLSIAPACVKRSRNNQIGLALGARSNSPRKRRQPFRARGFFNQFR